MAQFINKLSCPRFIVSHVRCNLKSDEIAYKKK